MPRAYVIASSRLRYRAICDCLWLGRYRWLRASAIADAQRHYTFNEDCYPGEPLVLHV